MRAIGFHGTSIERAERILAEGFRASRNEYDWLGDGIYFFQDAPLRAREWARKRFEGDAAVIGAEIDLTDCLDLLDLRWQNALAAAHASFVMRAERLAEAIPVQTRGAHRLDRAIINYAVDLMADEGVMIRSVRAAFAEGPPIFAGSAFLSRSHVQIAVRDHSILTRTWLLPEGADDARSR